MKKILIIEDEEDIRSDVLKMLKYEGFEAFGAENGRIGVQLARQHHPDLIVCDIIMSDLNGYKVLAALRSNPTTATIPFIFLTARATKEDMRKGMSLGADDYLAKPFTITELLSAIQVRLERHASMAKHLEDLRVGLGVIMPSEIRNALTGILGFSEFLMTPEMLPGLGEIAEIGKVIYESGLTLQRLVENYLIYAELKLLEYKPDTTSAWLEKEEIKTKTFVSFFSRYKAKKAKRQNDLNVQLVNANIAFSSKSFQKILIELLDNAFKFSQPGQPVRVVSTVKDRHFFFHVIDHGSGMSKDQISHIGDFANFEENWHDQQGPGMGLILSRMLIELNGGKLSIKSMVNQQTTVTVVLPNVVKMK
jgi:two-component system sensor histidine kinase/response regulator